MPPNDTEALLDGDLELKKRSRRRLVGAIALALLAVVVLPMVMDHQPRPPTQDIQVKIPSPDAGGFTSRILPAKPAAPDAKSAAKPEATPPEAPPQAAAEAKPAPEAKPEVKPEPRTEAKTAAAESAKVPEKPAAKAPTPAKPAKEAAAAKAEEERRAKAALNGAAVSDQWVVQLGAYKESANVKHLAAKLKELGLPSYTEQFNSPQGPRTRVRAGPFASREAAEKAQKKIKAIGVGGSVAQQ